MFICLFWIWFHLARFGALGPMQMSTNSNIYIGGSLCGKRSLNCSNYIHFKFVLPSRSALTLLCPVRISPTSLLLTRNHISPTLLSLPHRGLDFKRHSKLFQSPFMLNTLCNSCHIFRVIHHSLKWPVLCLSQNLAFPFGPVWASHDHMHDFLGRVSTLAS